MPTMIQPINSWHSTVLFPVVQNILYDLMRRNKLPTVTAEHLIVTEEVRYKDTQAKDRALLGNAVWSTAEPRTHCSYTLVRRDTKARGKRPDNREGNHIIYDKQGKYRVIPEYDEYTIQMRILTGDGSHNGLYDYLNNLMYLLRNGAEVTAHDLEYSYIIPQKYHRFMKECYNSRLELDKLSFERATKEYDEYKTLTPGDPIPDPIPVKPFKHDKPLEWGDYIGSISTAELEVVQDGTGKNKEILFTEFSKFNQGVFTNSDFVIQTQNDSAFAVELEYEVYVALPTRLRLEYPMMIYNMLPSDIYLPPSDVHRHTHGKVNVENSARKLFERGYNEPLDHTYRGKTVSLTDFDTENEPEELPGYKCISTILVGVDMVNYKDPIINLNEFDQGYIDLHIKRWLEREEHKHINIPYKSALYVTLTSNGIRGSKDVIVDNKLNIYPSFKMGPMNTYRINLYMIDKLYMLSDDGMCRLYKDYHAYNIIADTMLISGFINNLQWKYLKSISLDKDSKYEDSKCIYPQHPGRIIDENEHTGATTITGIDGTHPNGTPWSPEELRGFSIMKTAWTCYVDGGVQQVKS